ncbi:MAG: TolC family protein, partial [Spirochaetales bacterium]|nr:TolC family protein [Spirochaetales bacterium]
DLTDINKEISQVEISIEEIWNGDIRKILELLMMPDDRVTEFIQDGEFRLIENGELYNRVLKHDSNYQTALREKRKAELDKLLGSPADAPRLGLALNLSPQYPGGETGYPDLGESFTQLFSSDSNPTLSFSVTLQVPDLLRKQKEFTSAVQKEQMKQAEAKLAEAVLGVQETLRDLQARIRSQYLSLAIVFEEFKIAEGDFQQEQRRLESGLSNQTLLRQRGLTAYRAAFQVMQSLRELSILSLELDLLQGGNF